MPDHFALRLNSDHKACSTALYVSQQMLRSKRETRGIQIGPEFQVALPNLSEFVNEAVPEQNERQVWGGANTQSLLPAEFDISEFIGRAKAANASERDSRERVVYSDDDTYMTVLHEADYDIKAALDRIRNLPGGRFIESSWSATEILAVQTAVAKHKDDLRAIAKAVPNKSRGQLVTYFTRTYLREASNHSRNTRGIKRARSPHSETANKAYWTLNVLQHVDRERLCNLFLEQAGRELDSETFAAFLHSLRLFDQRIIDFGQLAHRTSSILEHHRTVRDAFQFFMAQPLPIIANSETTSPSPPERAIEHPNGL